MNVSVITVVRNDRGGLAQTIASVRSQSYSSVEFIVIDGGSNDGTVKVIRSNDDIIDYWESESDDGIYDAMNKGLERATGEFVLFLILDTESKPIVTSSYECSWMDVGWRRSPRLLLVFGPAVFPRRPSPPRNGKTY